MRNIEAGASEVYQPTEADMVRMEALGGIAVPGIPIFTESTRSAAAGHCVIGAKGYDSTGKKYGVMKDSKDPHGPALVIPEKAWGDFIGGVRDGEFDLIA